MEKFGTFIVIKINKQQHQRVKENKLTILKIDFAFVRRFVERVNLSLQTTKSGHSVRMKRDSVDRSVPAKPSPPVPMQQ